MKSSRLPGKAMIELGEFPLVERVVRRAGLTGYPVILATSVTADDDVLEETMKNAGIQCYRGSEQNVLERAVLAAEASGFKAFARLCGDRPLFSVEEMKFALDAWQRAETDAKPDLITNHYPEKCVRGLTTEIVNSHSLKEQLQSNPDPVQQEHLTTGFYRNPEIYTIKCLKNRYRAWSSHSGFAVDTADDLTTISDIIRKHPELDYELDVAHEPCFINEGHLK